MRTDWWKPERAFDHPSQPPRPQILTILLLGARGSTLLRNEKSLPFLMQKMRARLNSLLLNMKWKKHCFRLYICKLCKYSKDSKQVITYFDCRGTGCESASIQWTADRFSEPTPITEHFADHYKSGFLAVVCFRMFDLYIWILSHTFILG